MPHILARIFPVESGRTQRKPLLLFLLFGLFLLRFAARRFLLLLFQEPPRSTRVSSGAPIASPGVQTWAYNLIVPAHLAVEPSASRRATCRSPSTVPPRSGIASG